MKRVTTASKMARAWRKIAANISERHKLVFGSLMGMRALVRPGQMATHWRRKNRDKREKGRSPRLKSQFWPNHFVARMNLSCLSAPKTCFNARETSFTARLQLWMWLAYFGILSGASTNCISSCVEIEFLMSGSVMSDQSWMSGIDVAFQLSFGAE